jgi:hypothetical protein
LVAGVSGLEFGIEPYGANPVRALDFRQNKKGD